MNRLIGQIYQSQDWKTWGPKTPLQSMCGGEYLILMENSEGQIEGALRDPLGLMPGYFTTSSIGELLVDHSLPRLLSRAKDKSINWDYIYSLWADNYESTTASPFKSISKLPAGQILYRDEGLWKTRKFFSELQASSADLRDTFKRVISDRAESSRPFSLFLSGGFDSSLLMRLLESQKIPVHALCLNFSSGTASEKVCLDALKQRTQIRIDEIKGEEMPLETFAWEKTDRFFYSPTLALFKPLLQRARIKGSRHVWTGLGADEVFVRDQSLLNQLLLNGEVKLFVEAWTQKQNFGRSPSQLLFSIVREFLPASLRLGLSKKLRLKTDLDIPQVHQLARLRREHRLNGRRRHLSALDAEMYDRLFESGMISFCAEQEQALGEQFQIQFCYPFMDIRLIACALNRPARFYTGKGLDKFGLRQSFADLLPREIAYNESTQAYDEWQAPLLKKVRESLAHELKEAKVPYEFSGAETEAALLKQLYSLHIQSW